MRGPAGMPSPRSGSAPPSGSPGPGGRPPPRPPRGPRRWAPWRGTRRYTWADAACRLERHAETSGSSVGYGERVVSVRVGFTTESNAGATEERDVLTTPPLIRSVAIDKRAPPSRWRRYVPRGFRMVCLRLSYNRSRLWRRGKTSSHNLMVWWRLWSEM